MNSDNHKMEIKEEPSGTLTQVKCEYEKVDNFHSETLFVSSLLKESLSDCEMCNKIEIKEELLWTEGVSDEVKQELELSSAEDVDLQSEMKETTAYREVITQKVAQEEAFRFHKKSVCRNSEMASHFFMGTNSEENNNPNVADPSHLLISSQSQTFQEPATLNADVNQNCEITHVKKRLHKCEICNRIFQRPFMLRDHKLIHEGKRPNMCEVCNKSFTQPSVLKLHKLIHEGKRPHTCKVCNRCFTHGSTLKNHELIHEGKRPHTCKICNRGFTQLSTLQQHKFIHEGKKPHTCEICEKSFTKSSNLKKHNLIHEGIRPYKCEICNKNFSQTSALKRHKLIHERKRLHIHKISN